MFTLELKNHCLAWHLMWVCEILKKVLFMVFLLSHKAKWYMQPWQVPNLLSWFVFWLGRVQFLCRPSPNHPFVILYMLYFFSYSYCSLCSDLYTMKIWRFSSFDDQSNMLPVEVKNSNNGTSGGSMRFWEKFHFLVFLMSHRQTDAGTAILGFKAFEQMVFWRCKVQFLYTFMKLSTCKPFANQSYKGKVT